MTPPGPTRRDELRLEIEALTAELGRRAALLRQALAHRQQFAARLAVTSMAGLLLVLLWVNLVALGAVRVFGAMLR